MSQVAGIIDRLQLAVGVTTKRALANFLTISPSNVNQALERNTVPDLWLYKVAVLTGVRVEWLRDGTEPKQYVELLSDAAAVTEQLSKLQAEIARLATSPAQSLRLVHTVQDAAKLIQAAHIAEASAHYAVERGQHVDVSALDADGRATVHRLIHALLHADEQIKVHLIGQLKIIEDAAAARKKQAQTPQPEPTKDE